MPQSSYNPEPHSVDEQSPDFYDVFKKRGPHFLHLNARSLLPKIDQVKHLATLTQAAVIGVTGTPGWALGYLGGCIRSLSKLKITPKALISGQKAPLFQ